MLNCKVESQCAEECNDETYDDDFNGEANDDEIEENEMPNDRYFDMINENSYVALYSHSNSAEIFYVCKVKKCDIATADMVDSAENSLKVHHI